MRHPDWRGWELVTTRVSDIDFHNDFIRIQSSRTKTRRFQAARVSQATLQAIKESIKPGQEWLFPGRNSDHLSTKTVLRTMDQLAEKAGIQEVSPRQKLSRKKVTPHILRHSHVVGALMAGVPVPMIQKQVGHKRQSTTEIYATLAPALVEEAYDGRGFGSEGQWGSSFIELNPRLCVGDETSVQHSLLVSNEKYI